MTNTVPVPGSGWILSSLVVAAAALLLGTAELALRASDFRLAAWYLDAPIFVPAGDGIHVQTDAMFTDLVPYTFPFVARQRFESRKKPGVIRIVLVGESSVRNLGVAPQLAAELVKAGAEPVEIINFGFAGSGSERVLLSVKEALHYSPDAIFVYTGHNEFISLMNPATQLDAHGLPLGKASPPLRTVQYASKLWFSIWPPAPGSLRARFYDQQEKDAIYETFGHNLSAMIAAARAEKVPIIFSTVAYNYEFQPGFPSGSRPNLVEARSWDTPRLLSELRKDPKNAKLELMLGYGLRKSGNMSEAREHIDKAFVFEARPDRANLAINGIIKTVALENGVPLLDFHKILAGTTGNAMPGFELFSDNCHLLPKGNSLLLSSAAKILAPIIKRREGLH